MEMLGMPSIDQLIFYSISGYANKKNKLRI